MAEDIFDVVAGTAADVASTAVGYGLYGGYRVGQATYNYLRTTQAPTNPTENNGDTKSALMEEAMDMGGVTEELYSTPQLRNQVVSRLAQLNQISVTRRNHNFQENTNLKKPKGFTFNFWDIFHTGSYNASKTRLSKKRYGKKKKTFYRYKKSR